MPAPLGPLTPEAARARVATTVFLCLGFGALAPSLALASPLAEAVERGDLAAVEALLATEAGRARIDEPAGYGMTALLFAVQADDVDLAHWLIDSDADRVTRAMRSLQPTLPGATISITGGFDRPPLERTAAVERLFNLARTVAADLGIVLE